MKEKELNVPMIVIKVYDVNGKLLERIHHELGSTKISYNWTETVPAEAEHEVERACCPGESAQSI